MKTFADVSQANLILQILLYFNVYLSSAWALMYGFYICYNFSKLWNFSGKITIFAYILALISEAVRLYMGYSGNLRSKTGDLNIFLIMAPLIQLPLMLFLLLSKANEILLTIESYVIIAFMIVEFFFGIYVWRKHSYYEAKLYQFKINNSLQCQSKNKRELY